MNAPLERSIRPGFVELLPVHLAQQIQLERLLIAVESGVFCETKLRILHRRIRVTGRAERDAVVGCRQKRRAVVVHPTVQASRTDGHKPGQVSVFRAEPVVDPRAHAGADEIVAAGVQLEQRPAVRRVRPVHRVDERNVIHTGGHLREQTADRHPALTSRREFPVRLKQVSRCRKLDARLGEGQRLAVVAGQQWLLIKRVHVRRPAVHEQENHPLGLRLEVRPLGREWIRLHLGKPGLGQQRQQREVTKTGRRPAQHFASADRSVVGKIVHQLRYKNWFDCSNTWQKAAQLCSSRLAKGKDSGSAWPNRSINFIAAAPSDALGFRPSVVSYRKPIRSAGPP